MPPATDEADHRLYPPLDRNSREIRLIEIAPIEPDGTTCCYLHTVTLTPETRYACLSYVWGDPSITEEIIVNGVRKKITVNLATALKHVKNHWVKIGSMSNSGRLSSSFRLWADALCINQDDPLERGHQVRLMADIYSSADMVLAWLSSNDQEVKLGFDILGEVLRMPDGTSWDTSYRKNLPPFLLPENSGLREGNAQLRPDEPLAHLRQFWKLRFWSRVWIQQEIILAKKVYYISSSHIWSHSLCWKAIRKVNICMRNLIIRPTQLQIEQTKKLERDQRSVLNLFEATDTIRQRFRQELKERRVLACINLHFSEGLQATDHLDYVYGLLAISQVPIEPDYTKSIREVHIAFVKWMVEVVCESSENTQRVYDLLDQHAVGVRQLHGLPTWAPVFSASDKRHNINLPRWISPPFHIGYRWKKLPLCEPPPIVTSEGSLRIKCIKIKTIEAVYYEPGSPDFCDRELYHFIHDFPKMYGKTTYIHGECIMNVLCCTFLLQHGCRYDIQRLFIALKASGQCRPEHFNQRLRRYVDSSLLEHIAKEWEPATKRLLNSMLFTTKDGYIGLIGEEVLPGDIVCCLANGTSLPVLRPKDDHYLFVNNCFITDFADESIHHRVESGVLKIEEIEIR
ncbi:hypothetical protein LB507_001551 [Fusarium sp. FIESC RH6]|nr:hypothetical protein LB507_001551 [Fusarium sp. FIESC RH6]